MRLRCPGSINALVAAIAVVPLVAVAVAGQTQAPTPKQSIAKKWPPPRTADGHPDLGGVWSNNNATPLERPKQWAGKQSLSDEEVAQLARIAAQIQENDGDAQFGDDIVEAALAREGAPKSSDTTGNYNQFWIVDRDFGDRRTSLITDPPDGRIPPVTPQAQELQAARGAYRKAHPADGPEDRGLGERCLNFEIPRLQAGYNSYYQVFQAKDSVAILMEMGHQVRIIPLDGRPHVNQNLRQWNGDSRGRWDGDTLVVETTNFSPKSEFRRGPAERLHIIERYTRVGPNTLNWEITVNDPTTWTGPWTLMIPLKNENAAIHEYACHEGNQSMFGILSGHRAQEKAVEAPRP